MAPAGQPANAAGRLHLCLIVEDLDAAAARIAAFGGRPLEGSRTRQDYGDLMFCEDPDGVRIEIIQMRGEWGGY